MPRFRKKPVVIEAVQFHGNKVHAGPNPPRVTSEFSEEPAWLTDALVEANENNRAPVDLQPGKVSRDGAGMVISTLEGVMRVERGGWIIRGIAGELYPCRDDVFQATYEAVE